MQANKPTPDAAMGAFRNLVASNHAAGRLVGRPKMTPRRKVVLAGMHVMPDELERARRLAALEDRPVSSFMRRLFVGAMAELEASLTEGEAAEQQKAA